MTSRRSFAQRLRGRHMTYAKPHCLSAFTFQYGASHPRELVAKAAELGNSALAVTDECFMDGIVRAREAAEAVGLHLIVGSFIRLEDGPELVLLAPDHEAYSELCRLIKHGRRQAAKGTYRLSWADMVAQKHCLAIWIPRCPIDSERLEELLENFPRRCGIGVANCSPKTI